MSQKDGARPTPGSCMALLPPLGRVPGISGLGTGLLSREYRQLSLKPHVCKIAVSFNFLSHREGKIGVPLNGGSCDTLKQGLWQLVNAQEGNFTNVLQKAANVEE